MIKIWTYENQNQTETAVFMKKKRTKPTANPKMETVTALKIICTAPIILLCYSPKASITNDTSTEALPTLIMHFYVMLHVIRI